MKKRIRTTKAGTIYRELHYLAFYALGLIVLPYELVIQGRKREGTSFNFWMRTEAGLREYEPLMEKMKDIKKEAEDILDALQGKDSNMQKTWDILDLLKSYGLIPVVSFLIYTFCFAVFPFELIFRRHWQDTYFVMLQADLELASVVEDPFKIPVQTFSHYQKGLEDED